MAWFINESKKFDEEDIPLLFGPQPIPLLLPRLFLGFLVPRPEAVEDHLDDGLLDLVLVRDIAFFVTEDLHGVVEILYNLGRARLETVSGGNHLRRDRLGICEQRHLPCLH